MADSLMLDSRQKPNSPPYSDGEASSFSVIPGVAVREILFASMADLVPLVADAYLDHAEGQSSNPPSQFLRFADRPRDRIIALPADLGEAAGIAGIKWISSWPENVDFGIPRASALLVLNRRDTGYPFCVMEASVISATRTAASAVLALEKIGAGRLPENPRVGFVGCGFIARYIWDMMLARGIRPAQVQAYDLSIQDASKLLAYVGVTAADAPAISTEALIRSSDVIVFATTASHPHVKQPEWFGHAPVVLHVSLRDLSTEIIRGSDNVVDDIDHVLQASTSLHLTEQQTGRRDFVRGTIADLMRGDVPLNPSLPAIFSPFGMGILDLTLAQHVYQTAQRTGRCISIPDFFGETSRW